MENDFSRILDSVIFTTHNSNHVTMSKSDELYSQPRTCNLAGLDAAKHIELEGGPLFLCDRG